MGNTSGEIFYKNYIIVLNNNKGFVKTQSGDILFEKISLSCADALKECSNFIDRYKLKGESQ